MTTPAPRPPIRVPLAQPQPAAQQPAPAPSAYNQPATAQRGQQRSATNMYDNISEAKTDTRFPWLQEPGRYLVQTVGWRSQMNQSGKAADVWDVEVLHTYRGSHQPGEKFTRMRVFNQWGNHLDEIKTRAVTLLTLVNYDEAGTYLGAVHPGAVTKETLQTITESNGEMFYGVPVVVEVLPTKPNTRSAGVFTPVNYFVPTAQDLAAAGLQ